MKLVTNDYGCGTSSSILDYGIEDVVIVSEQNYEHVFNVDDDLLFIGHDFLFYLWDDEDKLKKWESRKGKFEHWLWCFERIDAIIPFWMQKSHISLSLASRFVNRVLACDEDDCDKYGFDWLPQWASCRFFERRDKSPTNSKILFSGQAGKPEYAVRNELLRNIQNDAETKDLFQVTNIDRVLSWDQYIDNLLNHHTVLNPVGVLKSLNTRAYESLYSNRLLLQHTIGSYTRHEKMLKDNPGVIFFKNFQDLKSILTLLPNAKNFAEESYQNHSLHARMKSIGIDIK